LKEQQLALLANKSGSESECRIVSRRTWAADAAFAFMERSKQWLAR